MKLISNRGPVAAAIAGVAVMSVALGGTAVAAAMITGANVQDGSLTGADIKNGSLTGADIKNESLTGYDVDNSSLTGADIKTNSVYGHDLRTGTITVDKLTDGAVDSIQNGVFVGAHWGTILRNTQDDSLAMLRSGPYVLGTSGTIAPPRGTGSLQLQIGNDTRDKIAFGNEVDFAGRTLASINNVGFSVFATGEDLGTRPGASVNNLPNISFEIDPNGAANTTGPNYSSLVYVPKGVATQANNWRTYDAAAATTADGGWFFSNAAVAGCTLAAPCTWAAVKTAVPNAEISYSVAVGKGSNDGEFQGAVDELRIGADTFDFEARGVIKH